MARHPSYKRPRQVRSQDRAFTRAGPSIARPEADLLRNGIYELRIGREGINYRILYFFRDRIAAILAHGLVKEREVPDRDIRVALERKRLFEQDPDAHTYLEK